MRIFTVKSITPLYHANPGFVSQKFSHSPASCNILVNNFRRNFFSSCFKRYPKFDTSKISASIKDHSTKIFKACSKQCEFIFAHKVRRSQQIFSLYKKLWGDFRLWFTIPRNSLSLVKHKKLLFSLAAAPSFFWEHQRISENELDKLEKEIDISRRLYEEENPKDVESVTFPDGCNCDRCKHSDYEGWTLFYASPDLKIWRKLHEKYKDAELYVYKVYGKFNDVTANDFFQVQLDYKYRKEWDENSVQLYLVDSDQQSSSDVLYWEFLFPRMFYNRDYVCNRRYKIDSDKKLMSIVSQSVEHPACPEKPPVHRVKEYWSHTVIRPREDFDKPGMEFTITYFDNPELNIPSYISILYTSTGMPQYLMKQREAALHLARNRAESIRLLKEKETYQNINFTPPSKADRFLIY